MRKAEYRDQACLGMVEASIWYLSEAKVQRRENEVKNKAFSTID
ncbi:hypothetical protein [Fibrobacter sp.]|nr:hypothetical protein [Fibrobacter sp.]